MKTLFQKFLCVVMLAVATLFVACEPEYVQKNEEVDPSGVGFYAPDFKIVLKSKLCSEILLSSGSDGSMTFLDGAKISELGHWLMLDTEAEGDEGYNVDTLFASFNPPNKALSVVWEIEDPSVLELVSESAEEGYIVVKAKKMGETNVTASCEGTKTTIKSTVTDYYVTKMDGWDANAVKVNAGWLTENYTIFLESEDPNSQRLSQKVWMKMDKKPAETYAPIDWSVSEEGVVKLDVESMPSIQNPDKTWTPDTCVILPLKEGKVSVIAKCQYRTVEILVTVLGKHTLTPVDSLQIVDNEGNNLEKIWLSRNDQSLAKVLCWPDNAYPDYDGFKWVSLQPEFVSAEESDGDNMCSIKGLKKGVAQIEVSLGLGNKIAARDTVEVEVCNAVTALSVETDAGSTAQLQRIETGNTLQFRTVIDDAAAEAEFGHLVQWHTAGGGYITLDQDGLVTAGNIVTEYEKDDTIWSTITYQKYPGHPTSTEMVTKKSNPIICKVIAAEKLITFTPVSLVYTLSGTRIMKQTFTGTNGETLTSGTSNKPNVFGAGNYYTTAGEYSIASGKSLTYTNGSESIVFNSGTLKVEDAGGGAYTYTLNLESTSPKAKLTGSATIVPTQQ